MRAEGFSPLLLIPNAVLGMFADHWSALLTQNRQNHQNCHTHSYF